MPRICDKPLRARLLAAALAGTMLSWGAAPIAAAQTPAPADVLLDAPAGVSKSALKARQTALFAQVEANPDNVELALAYARVSAQLEDYEAAIGTLERFLQSGSQSPAVRLELGALYFKLGSYAASERYFRSAGDLSGASQGVRVRRDAYLAAIEKRTAENRWSGRVKVGAVFSTNAALSAEDPVATIAGANVARVAGAAEEEDFGVRASASFTHRYDLGTPRTDEWKTNFAATTTRYENSKRGDIIGFALRTGPVLAADENRDGLKARPFVEGIYFDAGHRTLYAAPGAGLELSEVLSDQWSVFGEGRVQYRDYGAPRGDNDGFVFRAVAGAGYFPTRNIVVRGRLALEREEARVGSERNWDVDLRVAADWNYDPGFAVEDKWTFSAAVRGAYRSFDDPDVAVDPTTTREDFDFAASVGHRFALRDGFGIVVEAEYFNRGSSVGTIDFDNLTIGTGIDFKF